MVEAAEFYSIDKLNTLGLKSSSRYFVTLNSPLDLVAISDFIHQRSNNYLILGGGSNIILPEFYNGTIIHNQLKGIHVIEETETFVTVKVMSGEIWDEFVLYAINHGWFGLENLSLIPGTVGAAPIQNIGAYGVEVKQFISCVDAFDLNTKETKQLENSECNFSYRQSIFKSLPNLVVTSVIFKLSKVQNLNSSYADLQQLLAQFTTPTALDLRNLVIQIRQSKLPDPKVIGNVGSFFHNPIIKNEQVQILKSEYAKLPVYSVDDSHSKISAGWLIDNLGLKGYRLGNVGVHDKQALVLVNHAHATQKELLDFAAIIQNQVLAKYKIQLNIEPTIIQ